MIPTSAQPNGQNAPLAANSGTTGGVGGPAASPPGGTPKNQRRMRPPQTFAGMQQTGMARPSPQLVEAQANANRLTAMNQQMQQAASPFQPTTQSAMQAAQQTVQNSAPAGGFQRSGTVQALGAPLMQQVMQLLNDPTQGLNEAAQSNFDRQNRVLGREFTTLREGLNENMAARGLDASTIAATRLGDLGARQAEAQADVAARIQEKLISDRAAAMQAAIQSAMGLRGQEFDMDSREFELNRGVLESDRNFGLANQRFGLDQELGRGNLALGNQRLALDGELGRGQLGLAQQRLGFDMNRDSRDFAYGQTRDAANDAFRNRDFDFRERTDARDFDRLVGRDAVADSQFDRRFQFDQNRDQRDFDYRQDRDRVGDTQWQSQFDRQNNWRTEDNRYRDSRDAIGDRRFDQAWDRDESRWQTGQNQWQQQFDFTRNNATTQNMLGLLQGMGFNNLSPQVMESLMRSLGITMPAGGSGNAPVGGGGGGGGWNSNTGTFF